MIDTTDRWALPLLHAGQAQKEITHNEAVVLIDALLAPVVEARDVTNPPAAAAPGQCWVVAGGASGIWAGRDNMLAVWTAGGWRFVAPREGMCVWSIAEGMELRFRDGAWHAGAVHAAALFIEGAQVVGPRQDAIPTPAGGGTQDSEAREAIAAILAALRGHGLIAPEAA
ncbi:DUF2793 domain-containing protein [Sphingomonas baiyangensis]|uniref:DUF2793 domain-containing protein n=1 Tax=Sphingomonas baiyangensis TaxID=2572576 RepID=A0A4U1L423_9SPHN|nr:DUF2793 domain-containing protein [Sphingomonas baiyangensis]TKD51649.1 DUF2793 domain-containing protein [Sphingomonas baiyangensis]